MVCLSNNVPGVNETKICIIGLGYVGLPLAIAFGRKFSVTAFDQNKRRIDELQRCYDRNSEVTEDEFKSVSVEFTCSKKYLANCDVYIIAVPTPINSDKSPDLSHLISATKLVGKNLCEGNVVVYESTVYPGATEDVCVPILETSSGLRYNHEFFVDIAQSG